MSGLRNANCTRCGHGQHDHLLKSYGCVWTDGDSRGCFCQGFEGAA